MKEGNSKYYNKKINTKRSIDNIKAKLKAKDTNSIETRVLLARVLLPT
jgi:hypothetical protein